MGVDAFELAELAGAGQLAGEGEVRQVAPLGAGLEHAARCGASCRPGSGFAAMFFVQGFSQYMSLPALAAFMAAVACQFGPVAISTASISLRSSSSRKSRYMSQFWLPYFRRPFS